MSETKIEVLKNGPLYITGDFEIVDHNENPIPTPKAGIAALCRCGASSEKPFCDGTHSKIGFQAAAAVNPDSAE